MASSPPAPNTTRPSRTIFKDLPAFIQQGQSLVFCRFHLFPFTRTFIVEAAEMKNAVDNHTVQFFVVGTSELVGIGEDGVE